MIGILDYRSRNPNLFGSRSGVLFSLPLSTHDLTECLGGDAGEEVACNGQLSHPVWENSTACHFMLWKQEQALAAA